MANKIEDLRVYQKAMEFWVAVNALIERRGYWKDRKLRDQIVDANDSITANISEGFEQPTDAAFVQYLFHAKGSLAEVLSRLRTAHCKRYITDAELDERIHNGEELSRRLGAFIRYLDGCGWNDRGRHRSRQRARSRDR